MASLTTYLQREFARCCPPEWLCTSEKPLLSSELAELLGYNPRADVVLKHRDAPRQLWIEFEVSRADPVANHAKFATGHLFQPLPPTDAFVSMVSSHVVRGRRNLAANTIAVMRRLGMNAFQTVLLPSVQPAEIKRLNHLDQAILASEGLAAAVELERALTIAEPLLAVGERRVHLAGDLLEVMLNVHHWNEALSTPAGRAEWGRRTVIYFVYDPSSRSDVEAFAPSKFCAYVALNAAPASSQSLASTAPGSGLSVSLYVSLDSSTHLFDGARARLHLTRSLGMSAVTAAQVPEIGTRFRAWLAEHETSIRVHPQGPIFLRASTWFR